MAILTFPEFFKKCKEECNFKIGRDSLRTIVKTDGFPKIMVGSQPRIIEDEAIEYLQTNYSLKVKVK
ncbi:hypothetical protein [Peptoniphilus catoniae]|uniref:hypothetical protein n=1 Tax=Peptoniphilus catoniae TaxID=1660341 RepID=UPI0010FEBA65|nr:hypothetical protein [Peptoniphilus catoniae]